MRRTTKTRVYPHGLLLCALALVEMTGCLSSPDRSPAVTAPGPGTSLTQPSEKLLPRHRRILEETDWLKFVDSNVDAIEYYDYDAFASPNGPAIGLSTYEHERRIVQVAFKGRDDHEVAATIVHEAAHLSGIAQVGQFYNEDIARAVEGRFRQDVTIAAARRPR